MPNTNQTSRCAALIVLCSALLLGLETSATSAENELKKVCKIGTTVNTLEPDGGAMNCRALGLQANAQSYQLGCQSAEVEDSVILTIPIDINDETARLTTPNLVANTENAKHAAEKIAACARVWFAQ
jgi:hypothetical protein